MVKTEMGESTRGRAVESKAASGCWGSLRPCTGHGLVVGGIRQEVKAVLALATGKTAALAVASLAVAWLSDGARPSDSRKEIEQKRAEMGLRFTDTL